MSRIGTTYQTEVRKTDTYTIRTIDDLIVALIASNKTFTLPAASLCHGDDAEKWIVNDGASVGDLTIGVPAGDELLGLNTLEPGQTAILRSTGGIRWLSAAALSDSGIADSTISTADSKGVSAGVRASVADSKVLSTSIHTSTADSKGGSAGERASHADSKAVSDSINTSHADSKGESASVRASHADSKAVSDSINNSTADSKGVSSGLHASTVGSTSDSKVASQSTILSTTTSTANSG